MIEAHFIVIEGIDGAGTSTQTSILKNRFIELGLPAHATAEPSSGPVGSMIRQILAGRLVVHKHERTSTPSWTTMSLLFAADRQDHIEAEISPNLRDGVNVICDRYLHSSVVYQSVSSGSSDAMAWIQEINKHAKKPDLVLYLSVDPEEAMRRRGQRDISPQIYENQEFQRKLTKVYDELAANSEDIRIITIDGNQSIEKVSEACWLEIERLREPKKF